MSQSQPPGTVLLSLEDISYNIGTRKLFEELTLHICEGDRYCLVGKNGVGKTTLMKIITGELEIDGGKRFTYPGMTIGYLSQQPKVDPTQTVEAYVAAGLPKETVDTGGYDYLVEMILEPLSLTPDDTLGTLSGGQLRRAGLARALVEAPDLLLLDEPTNHLDINAIEWLENYLAGYRGALLCVSHDRAFLANVSRKVCWLDRGSVRTLNKGYVAFEDWVEQLVEQEARELHNLQKKVQAEHSWTQGGVTGRRKRNVRRMRELHQLRDKLRKDKNAYNQTLKTIELDPIAPSQASKIVAEFKNVTHGYENKPILNNFNLRVVRGDRIGILGQNGSGKSTFLKLLVGELQPQEGFIRRGKNLEVSYFDQHRSPLNKAKTVWDTLCPDGGDYVYIGSGENRKPRHVCGYLKDFLFDPKMARDMVANLSGGQQNRLLLSKVLASPGSVLILDEPTNDLDMDTLDMLQEILSEYQGTLLLVSHDRDFLDRTVTKVLAFEGDAEVQGYIGGYSDYLEAKNGAPIKVQKATEISKKEAKAQRQQAEKDAAAAKKKTIETTLNYAEQHELETLPENIAKLENDIEQLQGVLADGTLYQTNPKKFDTATKMLAERQKKLTAAEDRWLVLSERVS